MSGLCQIISNENHTNRAVGSAEINRTYSECNMDKNVGSPLG